MDCPQINTTETGAEFMKQFHSQALKLRIPLSGGIATTHRCNLKCQHCYLGSHCDDNAFKSKEMSTAMILKLLDDIAAAGCLNLLITGGEPMLRSDFIEVYKHARQKGLIVTIFTNATLVNDKIMAAFKEIPPNNVDITVYGATEATYELVTGIKGSYKQCIKNIEQLLANKINVSLKTIIMTLNIHEFNAIEKMASDYGTKFRFDPMINGCFGGNQKPLSLRVSPEEIIALDRADEKRVNEWKRLYKQFGAPVDSEMLYTCGTGFSSFHIDAEGFLQPCLMSTKYQYDLRTGSFKDGWENFIPQIRQIKANPNFKCLKCSDRILCSFCPPFFYLETGDEEKLSEFCCQVGKARSKLLKE